MRLPRGKQLVLLLLSVGFMAAAVPLLLVYDSPLGWISLIISCSCTAIASFSFLMAQGEQQQRDVLFRRRAHDSRSTAPVPSCDKAEPPRRTSPGSGSGTS